MHACGGRSIRGIYTLPTRKACKVKTVKVGNNFIANSRGRFQGFGRGGGFQVTFKGKTFGNAIIYTTANSSIMRHFGEEDLRHLSKMNLKTIL